MVIIVHRQYRVSFDGWEMSRYCRIYEVLPSFSAPVINNYYGLGHQSGSRFRESTLGQLSVTVKGRINFNVLDTIDEMNKFLYTTENKELIIGDRPDRYLLCKPDGELQVQARKRFADFEITFLSPDWFWRSTEGEQMTTFDGFGRAIIDNKGTAPTPPIFEINFEDDCGYLGIVSPTGYIALGSKDEKDKEFLPASEYALNSRMESLNTWIRVTNAQQMIPDYKKMTSNGSAKFDDRGTILAPLTLAKEENWQGHAYIRDFNQGVIEKYADNFELLSQVRISNFGKDPKANMAMLIVVMDDNNIPIMSTSVYDASSAKDELTVTFKIPESAGSTRSKIIHTGHLTNLNGTIRMEKMGNTFKWRVDNERIPNAVSGTTRKLKVGDIVHLTPGANTIYDWNGRRLRLDQRIKGDPLRVQQVPNNVNGRYLLANVRYGYVEGFFDAKDIKETQGVSQTARKGSVTLTRNDSSLGQLRPSKVFFWQAKWGTTPPYSSFAIDSMRIKRKYSSTFRDIENTFMAGDKLIVNNLLGEITLNDAPFEGLIDYDSRFFSVEGGKTEITLMPSSWSRMPKGSVRWGSRWL